MSVSTKIERLRHENETLRSTVEKLNSEVEYGMHASVEQDGEIASLRAQLAEAKQQLSDATHDPADEFSRVKDERDEARAALAQAQAEAGAMREELSLMVSYLAHQDQDADHAWMAEHMRKAALSSTAGRALLERVRRKDEALRKLLHWFGDYPELVPDLNFHAHTVAADIAEARAALREEDGE